MMKSSYDKADDYKIKPINNDIIFHEKDLTKQVILEETDEQIKRAKEQMERENREKEELIRQATDIQKINNNELDDIIVLDNIENNEVSLDEFDVSLKEKTFKERVLDMKPKDKININDMIESKKETAESLKKEAIGPNIIDIYNENVASKIGINNEIKKDI